MKKWRSRNRIATFHRYLSALLIQHAGAAQAGIDHALHANDAAVPDVLQISRRAGCNSQRLVDRELNVGLVDLTVAVEIARR